MNNPRTLQKGFTLIEVLIVISIMAIISMILVSSFSLFNKSQALDKDADLIVESLEEARSKTLASHNASQYGVYFASTTITIFTGTTYSSSSSTNRDFPLTLTDRVLSISLFGGGNNVVFNRLTGETGQYGTVVISSPTTSRTRTVTIHKTGVIETN